MSTESTTGQTLIEDQFPMLVIGRDHRVSFANYKAHVLFGYGHRALNGMSVEQVLAPSRRKEVRNVQAVLHGQAARRWHSAARLADGSELEANLTLEACLDDNGEIVAVTLRCEPVLRAQRATPRSAEASGLHLIPHTRHLTAPPPARREERIPPALRLLESPGDPTRRPPA